MYGLARRSPMTGLSTFNDVDRLFDNLLSSFSWPGVDARLPSVDIYSEDDRTMVVEMQAPGFDRDDLEIEVRDGVLEVRGQRTEKEEHKDKQRTYMLRESNASFARRVVLPDGADSEHVQAELDNGVLRVTVPVQRAEGRRIEIGQSDKRHKAKLSTGRKDKG